MNGEKIYYTRILSPVHVGCDEVYEPMGFVVDENTCTLTAFDPLEFFRHLGQQDKDRLTAICRKGSLESIMELYKFMRNKRFDGYVLDVCRGFVEHYKKSLSASIKDSKKIQQELNNFTIARTAFSPITQQPYIPGSAIKGALRTAYLNQLAVGESVPYDLKDRKAAEILEKGLLHYQDLQNDPFRLLKVSDFHPVRSCRTKIVYAVNEKKKVSNKPAKGPYQILEIIEPGAVFAGTINVLAPLTKEVIRTHLNKKALLDSAVVFYTKEKDRENNELAEIAVPADRMDSVDSPIPLRMGRHSGAESVTIDGHRNILIMQGGNRSATHGPRATTFWLASESAVNYEKSQLRPFGWVVLSTVTPKSPIGEKEIIKLRLPEDPVKLAAPQREELKPVDKFIASIKQFEAADAGKICSTIDNALKYLASEEDKRKFAQAVKEHMGKDFKKSKASTKLEPFLRV